MVRVQSDLLLADGAIQIQRYHCSVPGCKKTELAPILCNYCNLQICLGHRWEAALEASTHSVFCPGTRQTTTVRSWSQA